MSAKKWLVTFILTALLLASALAVFNVLTDPFGVFGDRLLNWYSYDETNNPRAAKGQYLRGHLDDYDSYILGCSSTSSYPVAALNELYNASFYNYIVYGADMLDTEQMAKWLLEHDDVRYIFLNVYIDNGLSYDNESNPYTYSMPCYMDGSSPLRFYSRFAFASPSYGIAKLKARKADTWLQQSFDVFLPETGEYDKRKRDIEHIGALDKYLESYPVFTDYPQTFMNLNTKTQCMESVARIRELCEQHGAELIVAAAPLYCDYLNNFDTAAVQLFYTELAQVTDFWDFSYSSVSFEPRYFYDGTHFRNAVGDMIAARLGGDTERYVPEDFGFYVTKENAAEHFASSFSAAALPEEEISAQVSILTYHHLDDTSGAATITPENFEAHMQALLDAGYTAVSLRQLEDYVLHGKDLPEKPVVITFDDGYESNYTLAYPILQKYQMCATIFVIGATLGADTYKDTGVSIHPHFNAQQAKEMVDSGLISIQSHTFDMHQSTELDGENARTCVRMLEGETEEAFITAMRDDFSKSQNQLSAITGQTPYALSYPTGIYSDLTQAIAREQGFRMTFTSDGGTNTLVRGLPQSLYALARTSIPGDMSAEELLLILS